MADESPIDRRRAERDAAAPRNDGRLLADAFRLLDLEDDPVDSELAVLAMVRGNELDLTIELGRTEMALEDVLKLQSGSIVPLDNLAGDPVDVVAGGRLVARGEVVVVEDTYCVRIVELFGSAEAA